MSLTLSPPTNASFLKKAINSSEEVYLILFLTMSLSVLCFLFQIRFIAGGPSIVYRGTFPHSSKNLIEGRGHCSPKPPQIRCSRLNYFIELILNFNLIYYEHIQCLRLFTHEIQVIISRIIINENEKNILGHSMILLAKVCKNLNVSSLIFF